MSDVAGRHRPLLRWALLAFAFPSAPIPAMGLPLVVHLPPFHAGALGLGITVAGFVPGGENTAAAAVETRTLAPGDPRSSGAAAG
ncbi:MAG TPA: hypothetical protein VF449_05405 [Parvibaculum sp.]